MKLPLPLLPLTRRKRYGHSRYELVRLHHRGRTVEIPAKIERIAPLGFTPRVLTYLGLSDKFVGIQECEIAKSPIMAYAYPHREEWAKLPNTGTDALGAGLWNAEVLIQCKPDVIITTLYHRCFR